MARRFHASAIVLMIVLARLLGGTGPTTAIRAGDLAIRGALIEQRTVARSPRLAATDRAVRFADSGPALAVTGFVVEAPARTLAPPPVLTIAPATTIAAAPRASARAPPA